MLAFISILSSIFSKIKSTELVEAYIERIIEIQPLLNCVVATCFDEAIQVKEKF